MEAILSKKVTGAETVSPHVFNNLINNLECESGDCKGQVIFSGSYTVEQYLGTDTYFIDIYADNPDYIVKADSNANYVLKQRLFDGQDQRVKIVFSDKQMEKLQAVIDGKVSEFTPDVSDNPIMWIGSKQWVFETGISNGSRL